MCRISLLLYTAVILEVLVSVIIRAFHLRIVLSRSKTGFHGAFKIALN